MQPPKTEKSVVRKASKKTFFLFIIAKGISNKSGGIGKKIASLKDSKHKIYIAYLDCKKLKIRSFVFLKIIIENQIYEYDLIFLFYNIKLLSYNFYKDIILIYMLEK